MARAQFETVRELSRTIPSTIPSRAAEPSAARSLLGYAEIPALEVLVAWGDCVIGVVQYNPPRNVTIGEANPDGSPCDFLIPRERLGFACLPIVNVKAGMVEIAIPASAHGYLDDGRGARTGLERLRAEAEAMVEVEGARRYTLQAGQHLIVMLGLFSIRITACEAAARPKRALFGEADRSVFGAFAATLVTAGAFMASMAYFVPDIGGITDDELNEENVRLIQQYLMASALRELQTEETPNADLEATGERGGESGHRSPGDEGKTGSTVSKRLSGRVAIAGPRDNPNPHLGRAELVEEARHFGMNALLGAMNRGHQQGTSSPWGVEAALGRDDLDAMGHLFGDTINDAAGFGGLGMSGTGQGGGCVGGGCGAGIGIDHVGTIGGGMGFCDPAKGPCDGMGRGNGHGSLGGHRPRVPRIRTPSIELTGRLPPEVIQRIVRQNFGRFRYCYEQGLAKNPNLEGRVTVRFVIGRDGAVSNVQNGGSDLPDSTVTGCIFRSFYGLSFPAPEGGLVTVSYPIALSPG